MTDFDLVIFDMDGTLVDSEHCSAQALSDVIDNPRITPELLLTDYRGVRLVTIIESIEERFAVKAPDDTISRFRVREEVLGPKLITANPGVSSLLTKLTLSHCIASNAPQDKTKRSLRTTGLDSVFSGRVFSAYDVNAWKPDPTLFLHAATYFGVSPERCLVVEDSSTGIEAGLAAGMRVAHYLPHGSESVRDDIIMFSDFDHLTERLT